MGNPLLNRRRFLGLTAALAAETIAANRFAAAYPLGLPLGVQLYSVRTLLPKDYLGTLKQIAALGYTEVEAAGFYDHPVEEVKSAMQTAGLHLVSSHYPLGQLKPNLDSILDFAKTLGISYIVCSSPMHQQPGTKGELSLDDWRWNADQFNQIAAKVQAAGMNFAYHNHVAEFTAIDGTLPWEELVKHTDPKLVNFEMDCGWVEVAGGDPVTYLTKYPTRVVMLHVKDFKDKKPPSVPLGEGAIDYTPILKAAKHARIKHIFVEQEESPTTMMESLAIDVKYMQKFK
jgi:sugar phosphate isomerase/epimerase